MVTDSAITCPRCGASTPLPEDLRVPTFSCRFCQETLETATFAGAAARSADALIGHIRGVVEEQGARVDADAGRRAPRFEGGSGQHRASSCKKCGAVVQVSLDLEVNRVRCAACGHVGPIAEHVSDQERLELDMARQVAGNERLKQLIAEGVPCGKCGGHNPVPGDGTIQVVCRFCGAAILLSDHVDESALARQRLKHGVFQVRDELIARQSGRDRLILGGVAALVGVGVAVVVCAGLVGRLVQ